MTKGTQYDIICEMPCFGKLVEKLIRKAMVLHGRSVASLYAEMRAFCNLFYEKC